MHSFKSVSQRFIPDNELPIIRRIQGKGITVFEFHMSGESYYEWCHSYIIGNNYGGISMVCYIPRLADGRWLYELYLSSRNLFSKLWPTLCEDFENAHWDGLYIENKKSFSRPFIAPFWDFDGNTNGDIWCVEKLLVDIDNNNLVDFPENLSNKELQYLRKSALELLIHCKKLDNEIKKECSIETMTQISDILRYNPFVNHGSTSHIPGGCSVKYSSEIKNCAILSEHAYGNSKIQLPNYCKLIETLVDEKSGVSVSVYSVYDDEIICAFPGSKKNKKDWETNLVTQPLGVSVQYDKALEFGRLIWKKYNNNVLFVGHSKGGGEAAYCAASLGARAIIFNPAWLSNLTIDTSLVSQSKINSYVFWNDVLNMAQELLSFECPVLNPYINRYLITDYLPENINIGDFHGMKGILRYFNVYL